MQGPFNESVASRKTLSRICPRLGKYDPSQPGRTPPNDESGANGSSHSLVIQPNGVVVSPAFCVSSEYPSFSFFARQVSSGGWGSALNVSLRWTDHYGWSRDTRRRLASARQRMGSQPRAEAREHAAAVDAREHAQRQAGVSALLLQRGLGDR